MNMFLHQIYGTGTAYLDNNLNVSLANNGKEINYNYLLFANWNGNNWKTSASSFIMKYCKIIRNNVSIKHFIPCKSTTTTINADGDTVPQNTKGLYDIVEGKFYTNQGTGEFIAGPDVQNSNKS